VNSVNLRLWYNVTKLPVPEIWWGFGAVTSCCFFCFPLPWRLCACAAAQDAVTHGYSSRTVVTEIRHSAYQSPVWLQAPILLTTELHSRCATCARVYRCAWILAYFRPGL